MSGNSLNYGGDERSGVLRNFTFESNIYWKVYLYLQEITGLRQQKDLLKWIDDICNRWEAEQDLLVPRFNRKPRRVHD